MKRSAIILGVIGALGLAYTAQATPIGRKPLTPFAAAANPVLTIVEFNGTLTADENGTAVILGLGGTTDHWTVQLPSGWSFNSANIPNPIVLGEPEDPNAKNNLSAFTNGGHFTWESDIGAPNTTDPFSLTIANAGVDAAGRTFNLTVVDRGDDPVTAPDSGTTVMLLGCSLTGLAVIRRWLTR